MQLTYDIKTTDGRRFRGGENAKVAAEEHQRLVDRIDEFCAETGIKAVTQARNTVLAWLKWDAADRYALDENESNEPAASPDPSVEQ